MSDYERLSRAELETLAGEELSERVAVSLINANVAIAVNAAVAADVLCDGADADAFAARDATGRGNLTGP